MVFEAGKGSIGSMVNFEVRFEVARGKKERSEQLFLLGWGRCLGSRRNEVMTALSGVQVR